tara:strand:+ start:384 stop:548 length:165 start_codon:yes stop_codon:yes gene_type:complete
MKFQLSMYAIGFLILIISNITFNNLENNQDYKLNTFNRCLEIEKALNGDLKKCF